MRFANLASALLLSFLPFAPTVFAQTSGKNAITFPNLNSKVDTSEPFTITWKPDTKGTVTIELLKGPQKNLNTEGAIAGTIKNTGSFTWKVPNSLEDMSTMGTDIYGFRIIDDLTGEFEYSPPFHMIVPDSTFVDPSKEKEKEEEKEEEEEEEEKPTSTSTSSTKTSTTSTSSTTSTKSTTSTTEKPSTTSSTSTSKSTTSTTTEEPTTTEETPTPTPEPTEDSNAQQTEEATPTPDASPAKEEKKDKGNPLGIPIIAWVGIGIGGLFAALILTYCISLGVRNAKLRREERERALMPGADIKPTQAAGPYKQLDDDLEKAVLAETKGTVPYGAATFVTPHRSNTTTSTYSNNGGFGAPNQRGNNIEMAEYGSNGNNGGYYEEPAYNQNYNAPQAGQHAFQDGYGQQQQPFRGPQQGYPSADANGAFSEHYGNYPAQQQPYNGGNGNHQYRY
ncbi:hypothetical protein BJ508DRAFT_360713 [Ascobolus immersus RN42]|uniref:Yeast cell wall synthesis Kre9/Knh1-like N-terminal domain-containing protein n=1 Tax=Ascobolus immersus RN42 TaxID=1160509 RepID=A0A3N4IAA9_ASCIM|nr:hypothetical protein BJ508DRAFT_360713 [Ascobolus immersus RN42]